MSITSFFSSKPFSTALNKLANCDVSNLFFGTTVASNVSSSVAHCYGIMHNPENDEKSKPFLLKQEVAECGLNIAAYSLLTKRCFGKLANNLVESGKILSKKVVDKAAKNNIDITDFKKISTELGKKASDTTIPENLRVLKPDYDCFKQGVGLIGTITGGLVSSSLVVPVLKDTIASRSFNKANLSQDKMPVYQGVNYSGSMKI